MVPAFTWRDELAKRSGVVAPYRLDRDRTALVIVDMQNVTAARRPTDGSSAEALDAYQAYFFGRIEAVVVPSAARLLAAFREARLPVVHLTVGSHRSDGLDFEPLRRAFDRELRRGGRAVYRPLAAAGTEAHAIIRPLAPQADEIVLNKVTRSAFTSTGLDQVLRNLGLTGFVIAGVATNACVGLTASDGGDRGYKVVMVEDATAAPTPTLHEAALLNFAYLFGHVRTTTEVLAELALGAPAGRP